MCMNFWWVGELGFSISQISSPHKKQTTQGNFSFPHKKREKLTPHPSLTFNFLQVQPTKRKFYCTNHVFPNEELQFLIIPSKWIIQFDLVDVELERKQSTFTIFHSREVTIVVVVVVVESSIRYTNACDRNHRCSPRFGGYEWLLKIWDYHQVFQAASSQVLQGTASSKKKKIVDPNDLYLSFLLLLWAGGLDEKRSHTKQEIFCFHLPPVDHHPSARRLGSPSSLSPMECCCRASSKPSIDPSFLDLNCASPLPASTLLQTLLLLYE